MKRFLRGNTFPYLSDRVAKKPEIYMRIKMIEDRVWITGFFWEFYKAYKIATEVQSKQDVRVWYSKGLRFQITMCGDKNIIPSCYVTALVLDLQMAIDKFVKDFL